MPASLFITTLSALPLAGTAIPWPLSDQRPLPANLPASLLAAEGPSMYWHWKNLYNFEVRQTAGLQVYWGWEKQLGCLLLRALACTGTGRTCTTLR